MPSPHPAPPTSLSSPPRPPRPAHPLPARPPPPTRRSEESSSSFSSFLPLAPPTASAPRTAIEPRLLRLPQTTSQEGRTEGQAARQPDRQPSPSGARGTVRARPSRPRSGLPGPGTLRGGGGERTNDRGPHAPGTSAERTLGRRAAPLLPPAHTVAGPGPDAAAAARRACRGPAAARPRSRARPPGAACQREESRGTRGPGSGVPRGSAHLATAPGPASPPVCPTPEKSGGGTSGGTRGQEERDFWELTSHDLAETHTTDRFAQHREALAEHLVRATVGEGHYRVENPSLLFIRVRRG